MDKKRREIIITSGLILIFIFAWANVFKVLKKKAGPKPVPLTRASSADKIRPLSSTAEPKEKPREENLEWVRDPFSGKIYKSIGEEVGLQGVKLVGILWSKQKPTAIINNKICEIGTRISGFIVVDIKEDRVILNDGTRNFELKLGQ